MRLRELNPFYFCHLTFTQFPTGRPEDFEVFKEFFTAVYQGRKLRVLVKNPSN